MPQLGVRKQKQHGPEAKPLPPPAMGNIPLTCQGHSECSWLPLSPRLVPMPTDSSVIRTVYNRHLKGRKKLVGDKGQPGEDSRTCLGLRVSHVTSPYSSRKGVFGKKEKTVCVGSPILDGLEKKEDFVS